MNKLGLHVGSALSLCTRGGTSGSLSCVESPPADPAASGSSTKPSANGCDQSGKESPPAFAGGLTDVGLLRRTWLSDLHSNVNSFLGLEMVALPSSKSRKTQWFRTRVPLDTTAGESSTCSTHKHMSKSSM